MKIGSRKLFSLMAAIAALITIAYGVIHSVPTNASTSFLGNLPSNYTVYGGQLVMGKSCTCSNVGISGAPPPPPPCNTNPCYGSSNTRYGSIGTNADILKSSYCQSLNDSGTSVPPCFILDGDDAVVISGNMSTVKNISYYSFTFYQTATNKTQADSNSYELTGASVNLGLNNSNLKMSSTGQYFLIMTSSTQTLNTIKSSLYESGVPDQIINTYLIPASLTNVGKVTYPDQLSFLIRLTSQGEVEKQQVNTFVEQTTTNTKVAFIKAPAIDGDVTYDSIPKWEDKLRVNNIEYTTGFDQKLAALQLAVIKTYAQQGYSLKTTLTEAMKHVDAKSCVTTPDYCAYDSADALYNGFPCDGPVSPDSGSCIIALPTNSTDVVMLLGVDHSLVGNKNLAAYFSYESKGGINQLRDGTFSFIGASTQGSASQYVSGSNATNLYAVKISRSCGTGEPYCIAVPYLGGTPENPGFYILGRVYLDKVTGTAPNPANLIPARLLWFTKA